MPMTIRREDIDAGRVDFSDIAGPERVPLTHPGTMLAKQYLKPLRITPYRLAKDIKVPPSRPIRRCVSHATWGLHRHFGSISSRTMILRPHAAAMSDGSSRM